MVQFDPSLSSAVSVSVPTTLVPGSRLRLYATLSREEHAGLCRDGTTIQVWSDFGVPGGWSETSFAEGENPVGTTVQVQGDVGLSLVAVGDGAAPREASGDTVTLVATFPLAPLVGRTMQFTYRMLHASGAVSWLGSVGTNGNISVEPGRSTTGLQACDWEDIDSDDTGPKAFVWSASAEGRDPVVAATLGRDADWRGWTIGKEGPSSFTAVSSAVAERVALALLPTARPGTYVTYSPVLYYTAGNATLSLTDGGEVLFHPGDGESMLHASLSTGTWMDALSDKKTTLDVHSPYFLGVSVQQNANLHHIHFLPISGPKTASVTLTSVALKSLATSSAVFTLVDSTLRTAKFIATSSLDDVHVTVGPAGGEVLVVSGYTLRKKESEWSVACLPRGAGRVASVPVDTGQASDSGVTTSSSEDATSELTVSEELFEYRPVVEDSPERHTSSIFEASMLLLVLYPLRLLLGLVSLSMSLSSSPETPKEIMSEQPPVPVESRIHDLVTDGQVVLGPLATPRVAFEVTGKFAAVVLGEISKLAFSVNGKPLNPGSKDIGGVWLLESDAGDDPQLFMVTLRE